LVKITKLQSDKEKLLKTVNFLTGKVMQKTKGRANPEKVKDICLSLLLQEIIEYERRKYEMENDTSK